MSARWLVSAAALGALLSADAIAVAQNATSSDALERAVQVEPEGDPCLGEAVVRARVQKRLARNAELSDVEVVVHVAETPRLEVSRGGQRIAERLFESFPVRCNARRDAIAVAVALALERAQEQSAAATTGSVAPAASGPSATPPETPRTPAQAETASAASAQPASASATSSAAAATAEAREASTNDDTAEAASSVRDRGSAELDFGVHAGVTAAFEILPSVAFAGVVGADVDVASLGMNFSLSVLASLSERDEVLGGALESQLLLGRFLALGATDFGGVALEGGFGVLAGGVFARGDGYASDRSTQLAYVAPLARAALRFPAQNVVMARIALDGMVAAVRPSYAVRAGTTPDRDAVAPSAFGFAASLEIAFDLN